jgi:hypothetical protein
MFLIFFSIVFILLFLCFLYSYNALLAVYYVMIIRFGYTENRIRDKFEVGMHWTAIVFALMPALAGIQLDMYHSANVWCWIAPSPSELAAVAEYCESRKSDDYYNNIKDDADDYNEDECLEQTLTHHGVYRLAFYYVVIWACLIFAIGCLAAVYGVIRQRELERGFNPRRGSLDVLKPGRYLGGKHRNSAGGGVGVDESTFSIYTQNSFIVDNNSTALSRSRAGVSVVPDLLSFSMSWGSQQSDRQSSTSSSFRLDTTGVENATSVSERMSRRPSFRRTLSNRSSSSNNNTSSRGHFSLTGSARTRRQGSFTGAASSRQEWLMQARQERFARERQEAKEVEAVIRAISQIKSSTHLSSVASSYASRQVYEQALLYTVTFSITYTFATINRVVQGVTGKDYFSLMLLHVLFMPLQVSTYGHDTLVLFV